jgi:hypothetical protein
MLAFIGKDVMQSSTKNPRVYIKTSVISYVTSRPSRDVVIAGRQAISHDWRENHRQRFEVRISALVEEEISRGDSLAAQGADYLLTWNFRHINNAEMKSAIAKIVESCGLVCPQICSPEELGGNSRDSRPLRDRRNLGMAPGGVS